MDLGLVPKGTKRDGVLVVLVEFGSSHFEGHDHAIHNEDRCGCEVDTGRSAHKAGRTVLSQARNDARRKDEAEENGNQAATELCKLDWFELVGIEL